MKSPIDMRGRTVFTTCLILLIGNSLCIADQTSSFAPVINNNNNNAQLSAQLLPDVLQQGNMSHQIIPSTLIDTQAKPPTRPAPLVPNHSRLFQLRPASAIEFPKVLSARPPPSPPSTQPTTPFTTSSQPPTSTTEAPPPSTPKLSLTTESAAIRTFKPPSSPTTTTPFPSSKAAPTTQAPIHSTTIPIPLSTSAPSLVEPPKFIPLNSHPSISIETNRIPPELTSVTFETLPSNNVSSTTNANTNTANNTYPILQLTPLQPIRNISTFPKLLAQNISPRFQTLKPQTLKLKNFRCSNDTDCNNGICQGKCYCSPGFTGFRCQTNVDECSPNPCFNNATCVDKIAEYECLCLPGYTGLQCESEVNQCQDNPCANNATCINFVSRYECQCQTGFKGDRCEINIDDCYSKPCLNNGTCIDGISKYTCDCNSTGYQGDHCEININDCEPNPCGFAAKKCVDLVKGYKCECHEGFTGTSCDEDIKECEKNPCQNGGTCIEKSANLFRDGTIPSTKSLNFSQYAGYKCECPEEYQGVNCEEKKKCYTRPHQELCANADAQCIDNVDGSYECQINASFDGTEQHYAEYSLVKEFKKFKLDEIKVKYRSVKGGVILSFSTSQQSFIELQLNDTGLYFNGTLTELGPMEESKDLLDGREHEFKISLPPTDINQIYLARSLIDQNPFKGCLMQVRLNNQLLPFYNYGDEAYQTFNIKHNNFEAVRCLVCFENDCMNGGQCIDTMDGFSCNCPSTFTGNHCEEDIDECKNFPSPCVNGQCENRLGGFKCNCNPGFSGDICKEISNFCLAIRPCFTGTCKSNGSLSFSCDCPSSHIGKKCEIERTCFNECNEKHSQCIQNRTCACLPGINHRMENAKCEAITSCDKNGGLLCQNGGTCTDSELGYQCLCPEGFQGSICEFHVAHPQFDVILLLVITCIGLLLATCAVVSVIVFKSVRRARATQGTYSPQSEEIYGDSARFDILKVPPEERLI